MIWSGVISYRIVGLVVQSSSRLLGPTMMRLRCVPSFWSVVANFSAFSVVVVPMSWCVALAGLQSGPSRLKMVLKGSSLLASATYFMAG